ncbi:hypothetical protein Hanom_Chr11g00977201 [Helianthus anomalus]
MLRVGSLKHLVSILFLTPLTNIGLQIKSLSLLSFNNPALMHFLLGINCN